MPKTKKRPSWRTIMRQAEKAGSVQERETLKAEALALRRKERKAAGVPERRKSPRKVVNLKATIVAKTDGLADMAPNNVKSGLLGTQVYPAAKPNQIGEQTNVNHAMQYSGEGQISRAPSPVDVARDAINNVLSVDASDEDRAVEIGRILSTLAVESRNDLERTHINTLKRIHEAYHENVVRSFMALIDGLGHANNGPVPASIVIPGLMAVRVYDALQKAGHSST